MSEVLELACALIERPSVTPEDKGCQDLIAGHLEPLGFAIEPMPFGEVQNLWARRGREGPLFAFAGHTDVVPPGPLEAWRHPPFAPTLENGCLYGRGAADMKGSLAAMVVAVRRFLKRHPRHRGSIAFLLTSDEEGPTNENGTVKVIQRLSARGEAIDCCLVGEPTSQRRTGDVVKNGRRGSLSGALTVHGVQGHVAYPELARNPIHAFAPALAELVALRFDQGNAFFPPTSLQFSNIQAGTGAANVIPGELSALFNFRYSTEVTADDLMAITEGVLDRHGLDYTLRWHHSGPPFLTPKGALLEAVTAAIQEETGQRPELSTSGGTSDGRFIAPTGAQVVELGPPNATIHKVDECVAVEDLELLARIYEGVLERLLG